MEGVLLPGGPAAGAHAPGLRGAASHGGGERDVLPDADREDARRLARGGPEAFRFALKGPQRVTHRSGCATSRTRWPTSCGWRPSSARSSGRCSGSSASMKKDLPRLEAFLGLLPRGGRWAFEFRHPTWFDDGVLDLLRGHGPRSASPTPRRARRRSSPRRASATCACGAPSTIPPPSPAGPSASPRSHGRKPTSTSSTRTRRGGRPSRSRSDPSPAAEPTTRHVPPPGSRRSRASLRSLG